MGFWSSLAGGLGSLIPGVGPIVGPLIGGALGAKQGAKQSGTFANSGMIKGLPDATSNLMGKSGEAAGTGLKDASTGMADLGTSGNFFKTILGGSREATQKLLGPEVSTVLSQYDNAAKTASELGPRGGGRTGVMAEAETGKAGAYGKLLGSALPGAASGLSDVGGKEGQIGAALTDTGMRPLPAMLGVQSDLSQAMSKKYGDLGSGLGSMLVNMFKSGKDKYGNDTPSIFKQIFGYKGGN